MLTVGEDEVVRGRGGLGWVYVETKSISTRHGHEKGQLHVEGLRLRLREEGQYRRVNHGAGLYDVL